jgi:multidrug resistance efflux pump
VSGRAGHQTGLAGALPRRSLLASWSRVAEIELEEAKANLQLTQELARATELLRQRTIRSPINGIVVARKLGPGEYAFDQAQLVTHFANRSAQR